MFILYWIAFQVGTNSVNIAYVSNKRGRRTFRKSDFLMGLCCLACTRMTLPLKEIRRKYSLSLRFFLGEG